MPIEHLLLTLEGSFAVGFVAGLLTGLALPRPKLGCLVLFAVPVAMYAYVSQWHSEHPENMRSTSGLDFVFGPLWPSLGAFWGYFIGMWLRSLLNKHG